jgi:hypothetical protein
MKNFEAGSGEPYEIDVTTSPETNINIDLSDTKGLDTMSENDLQERLVAIYRVITRIKNDMDEGKYPESEIKGGKEEIKSLEDQQKRIDSILLREKASEQIYSIDAKDAEN